MITRQTASTPCDYDFVLFLGRRTAERLGLSAFYAYMQSEHKSAFYASHAYPANPALGYMLGLAYSEVLSDSNNEKVC